MQIFTYLKYTLEFGIWYFTSSSLDLVGFSDADFVGCGIDQKNTSGTCHILGYSLVCWSSCRQTSVAQSTTEAEYVAAASYCSQISLTVHTMRDYRVTYKSVSLMSDSSSAIYLAQNPVFHGRAKHIKVRHYILRDHVEKEDIKMKYIETERQLVVIFTKPLDATHFASLRGELDVCHPYGMFYHILYLIFIALHFIHIYLIYLLLHVLC
jgi:hypothetical protein